MNYVHRFSLNKIQHAIYTDYKQTILRMAVVSKPTHDVVSKYAAD